MLPGASPTSPSGALGAQRLASQAGDGCRGMPPGISRACPSPPGAGGYGQPIAAARVWCRCGFRASISSWIHEHSSAAILPGGTPPAIGTEGSAIAGWVGAIGLQRMRQGNGARSDGRLAHRPWRRSGSLTSRGSPRLLLRQQDITAFVIRAGCDRYVPCIVPLSRGRVA
jgi:hypothetical protein